MWWPKLLGLLLFLSSPVVLLWSQEQEIPGIYWDYKIRGDHYVQQQEYFLAIGEYQKAAQVYFRDPAIHYRLGRMYGFLQPKEKLADREFALALNLYLQKFTTIESIKRDNLKEFFGIPIDPYEEENPAKQNPVVFIKKDLDGDNETELFVLLRRGSLSYALFAISYVDQQPSVQHLITFYEGKSGRADIEFIDLFGDGRQDVLVVSRMKDFLNVFIFSKLSNGTYRELLNVPEIFLGSYLFVDVKGDSVKEVEIYERVRQGIVFDGNKGPYLTQKKTYMWNGDVYDLVDRQAVLDEGYTLNRFFGALLNDHNFAEAFQCIHPELFLGHWGHDATEEDFEAYMQTEPYRAFVAENSVDGEVIAKQIELKEIISFHSEGQGWEEGGGSAPPSPVLRENEKHYELRLKGTVYELVLQRRGLWRIESLKVKDAPQGGWQSL